MKNRNHFRCQYTPPTGGRIGLLTASSSCTGTMQIETPAVVPIIDLVGGPPGPDRNGGLWRGIKWWLFLKQRIPAFQCNIMHLLDVDQASPDWAGWRAKPFGQWISDWQEQTVYEIPNTKRPDNGYPYRTFMNWWPFWQQPPGRPSRRPILFGESGGHALARESMRVKCEEQFEADASQSWILETQLAMGADIVMSLDYPLRGRLHPDEIHAQQCASIRNGLELLEELSRRENAVMPYIAVHATDGQSATAYIDQFMDGWRGLSAAARQIPFGVAVGSLSTKASQPNKLIEIMRGIRAGLEKASSELGGTPPVHMLGISSRIMPVLVYLGADTFSSQTYADASERGGYLDSRFSSTNITDLHEESLKECGCFICSMLLERSFLPTMKHVLAPKKKPTDEEPPSAEKRLGLDRFYHQTATGEWYTKSDLAALLAVHNWIQITREVERIRSAIAKNCLPEYIWAVASEGKATERLLHAIRNLAEADALAGDSRLKDAFGRRSPIVPGVPVSPPLVAWSLPADYQPPATKDILVLAGGQPGDELAKEIAAALGEHRAAARIHLVRVMPVYGPVPEEAEVPAAAGAVPDDSVIEYVARFRTHYQQIYAVGIAASVGERVSGVPEMVRKLRGMPKGQAAVQLSLWDI